VGNGFSSWAGGYGEDFPVPLLRSGIDKNRVLK
jgi:hypothetical protein